MLLPASVTSCNVGVATFKAWDAVIACDEDTAYEAVPNNEPVIPPVTSSEPVIIWFPKMSKSAFKEDDLFIPISPDWETNNLVVPPPEFK